MASAFQSNAFQNNAFQTSATEALPAGKPMYHYDWDRKIREKEDLIIEKRLEAQQVLIKQREEREREQTKQTQRQIKAMARAQIQLNKEIDDELNHLNALLMQLRINRNNQALMIMILSSPFGNLTIN